ncbi:MAG: pseudouridine synthase [Flavobacteriales bacterium]|nr:MAG: pseudouridine synthase [Flavobacteriales bacterium]|tara:strand:+ start:1413 stop:2096 length:684 start_codon:yes stop_codon:yes gene_type:complete
MRINKYLSQIGICSRREADKLVDSGRIKVNNEIASLGTKIKEGDKITIDNKLIKPKKKRTIFIAFNKPKGIVCTTNRMIEKNNIIDYINFPERIFPVGRLDKLSEGLIFLTNDGSLVNKVLRSRNNKEKEYLVEVNKNITTDFIRQMSNGIPILNTVTKNCKLVKVSTTTFKIILTQGINRQIRRMCEFLGFKVVSLKRIRIMDINLDVETGKWRHLSSRELNSLNN